MAPGLFGTQRKSGGVVGVTASGIQLLFSGLEEQAVEDGV